jgi:hypothetical protein
MSNITLFKSGNIALPDYLREADDVTKMLAGGAGGKQISIKGGVWRMVVGGEEIAKNEDRAMNFVVLAVNPHNNRTFYAGKYEEGKVTDPTCWSNDGVTPNEEVPAAQRQCATCANCPQNIAGSGEGNSRACRYSRRIAVALENDIEGNVYRLQLPAKSIFGKPEGDKMPLQAYAKFLSGHGVPITGVVTEARFDTAEAVPVLKFRAVRPLTREEWEAAKDAAASDDAQRAIEFKMVVRTAKAEPTTAAYSEETPKPKAALFGGAAVPARDADDEDEVIEEPVKRTSKKATAPVPAAKSSAADIMSAWGVDDDE